MELQILDMIQQMRTVWLDHIMVAITTLGNGGIIWIIAGLLLLISKKHRKTGILLLAAFILEIILCNGVLKPLAARVRPCDINSTVQLLVSRPTDYSFPSGHTGASFAAASVLWSRKEKGRLAAMILAVLIAFSRMYLYVHYPTDILGGMIVGSLSAVIVCMGFKLFEQKYGKNNEITV
ncbi:phosphatase PAP2 family protein [Brotonthovivens ammoniilytica]|uniref:Phosphatase PAP2 family protein n=1 Tax=Brotonthovivens ammoniilytica TaxID=2981725 RepID=A0ABT2TIG1_9FIRM|nr:phosphatase PAP2 family protein [Brotonthovivens ammoniilytica]